MRQNDTSSLASSERHAGWRPRHGDARRTRSGSRNGRHYSPFESCFFVCPQPRPHRGALRFLLCPGRELGVGMRRRSLHRRSAAWLACRSPVRAHPARPSETPAMRMSAQAGVCSAHRGSGCHRLWAHARRQRHRLVGAVFEFDGHEHHFAIAEILQIVHLALA